MYTYFYIPLLCLIAACHVKTNQGPQIHLRLVACGFSMSFCDLLFVFQKNRLFGFLWHLEYICIQYIYMYISLSSFFLNFMHLEFIEWMLYTQGLFGLSHDLGCGIFTYICHINWLLGISESSTACI